MISQTQSLENKKNETGWKTLVYVSQFFFGGWFLYHGLNHWFTFFTQPSGSGDDMRNMVAVLIDSGMMDIVKALEVGGGLLLLWNRFVPIALILSTPVSVTICYLNFTMADTFGIAVGIIGLLLNIIVILGYFERFLPLFAYECEEPSTRGIKRFLRGEFN